MSAEHKQTGSGKAALTRSDIVAPKNLLLGIVCVLGANIVLAALVSVLSLDVPQWAVSGVAGAVGVLVWFQILKSRKS